MRLGAVGNGSQRVTARTADARRALLVAHMACSEGTGGVPLISIRFAVSYPQDSSIHGRQGIRRQGTATGSRGWSALATRTGRGGDAHNASDYLSCGRQTLGAREIHFANCIMIAVRYLDDFKANLSGGVPRASLYGNQLEEGRAKNVLFSARRYLRFFLTDHCDLPAPRPVA